MYRGDSRRYNESALRGATHARSHRARSRVVLSFTSGGNFHEPAAEAAFRPQANNRLQAPRHFSVWGARQGEL